MSPVGSLEGDGVAMAVQQQGGTTRIGTFRRPLGDQGDTAGLGFVEGHADSDFIEEPGHVVTHLDLAPSVLWTKILRVDLNHSRADVDNFGLRAIWPVDKVLGGHTEQI